MSWRILAMLAFGFASGFPFHVVKDVLEAWMTDADVEALHGMVLEP